MRQSVVSAVKDDAFRPLDTTSVLRPARLLCPCCRGISSLEFCAGTVEFHLCRSCGGVWFYNKQMDDALAAAGAQTWSTPPSPLVPGTEHFWACPCCQGNLVAVHDRRGSGALVRRCLVCYGGWLQQEELAKLTHFSDGIIAQLGRSVRNWLSR